MTRVPRPPDAAALPCRILCRTDIDWASASRELPRPVGATPMVVWRGHGVEPPPDELAHMHTQLAMVVERHFTFEHYVDDNMRNIPDHYHAHARPVGGFFGHGLKRRTP